MSFFPSFKVDEVSRAADMSYDWDCREQEWLWSDHHRSTCRGTGSCVCGWYEMLASRSGLWKVEYARSLGIDALTCYECFTLGCGECDGNGFSPREEVVSTSFVSARVGGRRSKRREARRRAYQRTLRCYPFESENGNTRHEQVLDLYGGAWWTLTYGAAANLHLTRWDRLSWAWRQAHLAGCTAPSGERVPACRVPVAEDGAEVLSLRDHDCDVDVLRDELLDIQDGLELSELIDNAGVMDALRVRLNTRYAEVCAELTELTGL